MVKSRTVCNSDSSDELNVFKYVPRGQPKSGKFWKCVKTRARSIIKTRGLKQSLEKKQRLRQELLHAKEITRSLKEKRAQEKEAHRLRRKENIKRQQENKRKSEIVQVIKNTAKIKRMKKKQLRSIEKRDTLPQAKK